MKKFLMIMIVICLFFSLSACRGNDSLIEDGGSLIEDEWTTETPEIFNYYEGVLISPTIIEVEVQTLFAVSGLPEGVAYHIELCSAVIVVNDNHDVLLTGFPKPYEHDIGYYYFLEDDGIYADRYDEPLFKVKKPGTYILCAIADDNNSPSLFFEITAIENTNNESSQYTPFVPDNMGRCTTIERDGFRFWCYLLLWTEGTGSLGVEKYVTDHGFKNIVEDDIEAYASFVTDGSIFTFTGLDSDSYLMAGTPDFKGVYRIETNGKNVYFTYISGDNIFANIPGWSGETIILDKEYEPEY